MEAIGQLTGGLAHDFNNMLTVVTGNLQALRQQLGERSEVGDYLDPAMQAAQRGVELIKRLLTFSRQQPLEPQPVEVNSLIRGMAQLMRRSLPQSIAITPFAHEDDLVVMADPHQLENALLNLALNARDAMPNGGELRIESSSETLDAAAAADIEAEPGDYVQITVSDNGIGMDVGTLTRVFEPFSPPNSLAPAAGWACPWCMALSNNPAAACCCAAARRAAPAWRCCCRAPGKCRVAPNRRSQRYRARMCAANWCCWWKTTRKCAKWRACC